MAEVRRIGRILAEAYEGSAYHKAPRMGAALAYYTALSIGPLLLIAIAITGAVFAQDAA